MNLTRGINLRKIAEKMQGASGAESKVSYLRRSISSSSRVSVLKPVCTPCENVEST